MSIGHRGAFIDNVVITVNEGNFGANDGLLTFWDGTNVLTLGVGDTPNHLYVDPNAPSTGYVTCNGSHSVVKVELDGRYAIDTFAIPTSGYGGPRESTLFDAVLYVSTYTSAVYALNATTGDVLYRLDVDAKVDALNFYQNALWVARSYESGGYAHVPNVNVYDIRLTSVSEAAQRTTERRAILVTSPTVAVPELNAERPLTLINMQGASTPVRVVDAATTTVEVEGMAAGVYILTDGITSIALVLPGSIAAG
jgi:outer membrane protein assembly factor BamB